MIKTPTIAERLEYHYILEHIFRSRTIYKRLYVKYTWQFLNNVIMLNAKALLRQTKVTVTDFGYFVEALWYSCSQTLVWFYYLLTKPTLWRLFWKRVEWEIRYLRFYLKKILIRSNCFSLNFNPIPCLFFRSSYIFSLSFFPNDS